MITKEQVKEKVLLMLPDAVKHMTTNLDIVLSECESVVKLEDFDNNYILPKLILQALLKEEIFQYNVNSVYKDNYRKNHDKVVEQLYTLI